MTTSYERMRDERFGPVPRLVEERFGPRPGRWIITGTLTGATYPCRCTPNRRCGRTCPCRGRADVGRMPTGCCARRTAETNRRNR